MEIRTSISTSIKYICNKTDELISHFGNINFIPRVGEYVTFKGHNKSFKVTEIEHDFYTEETEETIFYTYSSGKQKVSTAVQDIYIFIEFSK